MDKRRNVAIGAEHAPYLAAMLTAWPAFRRRAAMGKHKMGGVDDAYQNLEKLGAQLGCVWLPGRRLRVLRGRPGHVGTQRRQQGHGRQAGRDVEREIPGPAYQSHLYPARGDGGQACPGDRVRRRSRFDGDGPHLRPAIRKGGATRRPHRPDRQSSRAENGEPRPHDGRDVRQTNLWRAALRRRLGAFL